MVISTGGNIFVAGWFEGDLTAFNKPYSSQGADIFIAQIEQDNELKDFKTFGGAGDDKAIALALNPNNNHLYLAALCAGVDFGTGSIGQGSQQICVARFEDGLSNTESWGYETGAGDAVADIVVVDDHLFLTGHYGTGGFNWGCGELVATNPEEAYVVKLDLVGNCQWAKRYGTTGSRRGIAIAADGKDLFVVGRYDGAGSFGGMPFALSSKAEDGFLMKLNSGGGVQWSLALGGAKNDTVFDVAMDGAGRVAVAGQVDGDNVTFGSSQPPTDNHFSRGFLARFDSANGGFKDVNWLGNATSSAPTRIGGDGDSILVAGQFSGMSSIFDEVSLSSKGGSDVFVATDANGGDFNDAVSFGGNEGDDGVSAMAIHPSTGNMVIAGSFKTGIDFGQGGKLTSGAADLAFLASLGRRFVPPP